MLDAYFRVRLDGRLDVVAFEILRTYLSGLLEARAFPIYRGRWIDVDAAATATGIAREALLDVRPHLQPLCDAICRASAEPKPGRKTIAQPAKDAAKAFTPKQRCQSARNVLQTMT